MLNAREVAHAIGFCEDEDASLPPGGIAALPAENGACPVCSGMTPCECDGGSLDDEIAVGRADGQAAGPWWKDDIATR